ncbi:hypothetical protein [Streptacidiphilus sp. EB129]|uniref:hypothetical protein n=1 Tax=Streptacidiphilus sp. EB129 TaxID=3156262 RepID=UPI0035154B71
MRQTHGQDAAEGGLDITISLTPAEADAIGIDAVDLAEWFDSVLVTLAMMRTGIVARRPRFPTPGVDDWCTAVCDTFQPPRLQGLADAVIRTARRLGLSYADFAESMDVSRSTAQSRVRKITGQPPAGFESWALGGDPAAALDRFGPMTDGPRHPADYDLEL